MRHETLLKIHALKSMVDAETLSFIAEIIVDVFKEGIEAGLNSTNKEARSANIPL